MYNSVRFKIKPKSHKNLNKIWLNIISCCPTCTSLVKGNKVEIKAVLLKRVERVKTTLFDWILCKHQRTKDNVIAVSRCLTLEGEYHYNKGANNISKGHHAGTKRRNICPLTIAVTSPWAWSLKTWQLRTLFSILGVKSSVRCKSESVIICKMPSLFRSWTHIKCQETETLNLNWSLEIISKDWCGKRVTMES